MAAATVEGRLAALAALEAAVAAIQERRGMRQPTANWWEKLALPPESRADFRELMAEVNAAREAERAAARGESDDGAE